MSFEIAELLRTISIYTLPVLFAITLHEAAHGYAARHFGDHTAEREGRITLNPLAHIDPIGTLLMPAAIFVLSAGSFLFGYAKPVPVSFGMLRNPKKDMVWVALAGPGSNMAQAVLWASTLAVLVSLGYGSSDFLVEVSKAGIFVNLLVAVFNLLPLPPLDGGRVLVGLLPMRPALLLSRVEPWGIWIVLGLMLAGVLTSLWIRPLMEAGFQLVQLITWPLRALLGL